MSDTIFALSSGSPPAGIAVVRISGPRAGAALEALVGRLPIARQARLVRVMARDGMLLDRALALWFPGPASATGEDCAELHLHGGRAVVEAVQRELAAIAGLRLAEAGEFTRRAFVHGRIDLTEADGLADLLEAETELQRRTAIERAGGAVSRQVVDWRDRVLACSAQLEAALDFADEDDVGGLPDGFAGQLARLCAEMEEWLERPRAERLREGYRVVLAGPPNAGKSTLFNALVEDEAAITSAIAGTTRDVIERSVALGGVPFTFVDTAGLRDGSEDEIEGIGIGRARGEIERADLVLWLGPEGEGPDGAFEIEARCDAQDREIKTRPLVRLSALTGDGLGILQDWLVERARRALPKPGDAVLNRREAGLVEEARAALADAPCVEDGLIVAEHLRRARVAFDRLVGRASTEDMLDALFGRFCIGK